MSVINDCHGTTPDMASVPYPSMRSTDKEKLEIKAPSASNASAAQ